MDGTSYSLKMAAGGELDLAVQVFKTANHVFNAVPPPGPDQLEGNLMGALKGFKPAALKAALAATNQGSLKLPDLRAASYSSKKTPQLVTVLAARLVQADRKALLDMLPKPEAEEVGNKRPNDPPPAVKSGSNASAESQGKVIRLLWCVSLGVRVVHSFHESGAYFDRSNVGYVYFLTSEYHPLLWPVTFPFHGIIGP